MSPNKQKVSDTSVAERIQLGEKLRQAREYLDLSQEEVAKEVNLPRAAISLIESGQRRIEALELKKFASVYQRPLNYFANEDYSTNGLPMEVEYLARTAANLSLKDREELARFAEFLQSRASTEDKSK